MYSSFAKTLVMMTVALLMLMLLISTTGCSKRYVVIEGNETITVQKSTLDNLYRDNELLIQALEKCRTDNDGG